MIKTSLRAMRTELHERIRTLVLVIKYRSAQANTIENRRYCPRTWLPYNRILHYAKDCICGSI